MTNKLPLPPTNNEVIGKINEIIDDKQDTLTAGTGIDITNNIVSITNPTLKNNTTSTNGISVGGSGSVQAVQFGSLGSVGSMASSFGFSCYASGTQSIAIGHGSQSTASKSYAFGEQAKATAIGAFQFGQATNSEAGSVYFGLTTDGSTTTNYKLLGSDGIIPNARLDLDSTPISGSTKPITSGGVYTAIGDIETLLYNLNSGS